MKTWNPNLSILGFNPTGDLGPLTIYTSAKRKRVISFPFSPPQRPPTQLQLLQRQKFRMIARAWSLAGPQTRLAWLQTARRARLSITGYDLFTYIHLKQDFDAARTAARQAHIEVSTLGLPE